MTDYDPWGAPPSNATSHESGEPTVQSSIEKERIIKDIVQLRDGLRGILVRVTELETDTDKLKKDNEFLGTYIDNLTRNTVVAAGQKR